MSELQESTLEHFRTHGWVRIRAAFSAADAAHMCDVIWAGLTSAGIRRADASTWTKARPEHLQFLKVDPVFRAIGTARTINAINEVLEDQPWQPPRDWGAFLLRDLCAASDPEARISRFHARAEEVDGVPLQVIENTSFAGDVILMHGLLLHAAPAAHLGTNPRFLLNKDIVVRPWW